MKSTSLTTQGSSDQASSATNGSWLISKRKFGQEKMQFTGTREHNDVVFVEETFLRIFALLRVVSVHDELISRVLWERGIQPSPVHVEIVAIEVKKFLGPDTIDE
jgi:hypothetical protein